MPKLFDLVVLDQVVDGPGTVYSDPSFATTLSRADKLVVSAVVSEVTGTAPALTIDVEGSPDSANWGPIDAGTPLLSSEPLNKTGVNLVTRCFSSDQGAFTRLKATIAGASVTARIKLHVTGRV